MKAHKTAKHPTKRLKAVAVASPAPYKLPDFSVDGSFGEVLTSVDVSDARDYPEVLSSIRASASISLSHEQENAFFSRAYVEVKFQRVAATLNPDDNTPVSPDFSVPNIRVEDIEALGVLFTALAAQVKSNRTFEHLSLAAA